MNSFEYASPTDAAQVSHLLGTNWQDGAILAGGTELLALMKDEVVSPKRLVNIKDIQNLKMLRLEIGGRPVLTTVGALTRMQDLADNAHIRKTYPALAEALDDAASPQIRNMATIGGNLLQRPRCWYFRNGFGLLAMKDGKSLVLQGDNRYHAILGNEGPAYFVSPSTVAPVLIAYGAKVGILGVNGKMRTIALEDLYRIPKQEGEREHTIAPGELLADMTLPAVAPNTKAANYEVRQKHSFDWPLATASVVLTMSGNNVQAARVVMGHVAPVPWVSKEAEEVLVGKPLTAETAQSAADASVHNAKGLGGNNYKIQYARVAVKRALLKAAGIDT
jgi:xanthine dehydrogenase YagS FAD-binding subunit